MSIFKSTFSPFVKEQLDKRQNAISDRTKPKNLQYYNSRNAWIRMSSSVNVNNSADLAKSYILQGGTLTKNKQLKSGLGDFSNAYSNTAYDGTSYRLGIRPMPGITSLEIKSKSAYGSLREATVNFQCWDIKQLEDLELLYMRPGYTVLVEWGWTPYLDNNGDYKSTFTDYYDILDKPPTERTVLFRELYEKSKKYGGNYDAMFGYIKNYQWSARMDGGYDCQVSVISTGEIIESLKVNYLNPDAVTNDAQGKLSPEFDNQGNEYANWGPAYNQNILAGIWAEAYYKLNKGIIKSDSSFIGNNALVTGLKLSSPNQQKKPLSEYGETYITLGCMVDIFNKYITAKGSDREPLIRLSLDSTDYDGTTKSDLLCVAHPLQVSVDPSICLIKSPLWSGGTVINQASQSIGEDETLTQAKSIVNNIIKSSRIGITFGGTDNELLVESIERITNRELYTAVKDELSIYSNKSYNTLQKILNEELGNIEFASEITYYNRIKSALEKITGIKVNRSTGPITIDDSALSNINTSNTSAQVNIVQNAPQALKNIDALKNLNKDFFYQNEYNEIGIIKNIYVNVGFLYQQALDSTLQGADSKEKNEISLFNYLKKIINSIQAAIGNVNNFGIHIDPVDNNVARIIDINYTEYPRAKYDDLFELKIQTLGSVVRSYNLQSQIFPDQSSIIAIGAQAKGGQLGIQNNTMIDFNKNLIDRIIPEKKDAQGSDLKVSQNGDKFTSNITNALSNIITLFKALDGTTSVDPSGNTTDYSTLASNAKNSLKDLIVYFQSITKSPGSNRNLIPTKFSCEMDGIGGLVIGHMFKLPRNVMPRGYRGVQGIGVQLGNAITSIGHTISNNDWVTKIDSLNIVMEDPKGIEFRKLSLDIIKTAFAASLTPERAGGKAPLNEARLNGMGKVDPSIPIYARALLDTIAYTEGTSNAGSNNGYDIMFSYKKYPNWTPDTTQVHPKIKNAGGGEESTAIGRYQVVYGTWVGQNGNKNVAISKKNQDITGYKLLQFRTGGNDTLMKEAYRLATEEKISDVVSNEPFLQMLGIAKNKSGLCGEWASICDRNGDYAYPPQKVEGQGFRDLYNIYLSAIRRNGGDAAAGTANIEKVRRLPGLGGGNTPSPAPTTFPTTIPGLPQF